MRVAYFILNSFDVDSRARLEVETIRQMGHEVEMIVTKGESSREYLGCPIHRIGQWRWPSRKIRFLQYNLVAALIGMRLKADIYHAVDLDTLAPAFWAGRKTGGRVIYEARELYTELEPLRGRNLVRSFWEHLERRLISKVDAVVTINESIAIELCKRYRIEKPSVIRNVALIPKSLEVRNLRAEFGIPDSHKILIYQGVLRGGQGLLAQLDMLRFLDGVSMIFVGDGPLEKDLREKASRLGLEDRAIFAERIPPDELVNFTASADAGMLLMEDVALNNRLALPQKLFQYLSAGIPQIVSAVPEISRFVRGQETGIVVNSKDPVGAAAEIAAFVFDSERYSRARENCRKSAAINNWETESTKWIEIYEELGSVR